MNIGSLSVKMGLVTVEWDQATAKVKQQAKDLQKSLNDLTENVKTLYGHWKTLGGALGAGALGMATLLHTTLEFANSIKDLSEGFGISIAKTLQFRDALKTSGVNAEGASKMMSTLFGKIDDATKGNEVAIAQFERMGISFKELVQLSPEQAINRIFKALQEGTLNNFEKVKLIKEFLGKAGIGANIEEISKKLNMSVSTYTAYADSIKKVGEVSDNLKTSTDNLKIAFASMIAPLTREGTISIEQFKAALVAMTTVAVVGGLITIAETIGKIIIFLKEGAKLQAAITAMSGGKGLAQLAAGAAAYLLALKAFDLEKENEAKTVTGKLPGAENQAEKDAKLKAAEGNRRELIAGGAKIALLKEQLRLIKLEGELKVKSLDMDKYAFQLQEVEITRQREIAAAKNQAAQALNKENLSQAQKNLIGGEQSKAQEIANEKAKQARAFIEASREKELKTIERQINFQQKLYEFDKDAVEFELEKVYLRENTIKLRQEEFNKTRKIAELNNQIEESRAKNGAGSIYEKDKLRIESLIEDEKYLSSLRKENLKQEEFRRTNFKEGWNATIRKFAQDTEEYGKLAGDMFSSAIGNMNNAIDTFVRTGKFSFKDFAKSVIQDILAMIIKFQAMQLVMAGMRGLGFGNFGLPTGSVTIGSMGSPGSALAGSGFMPTAAGGGMIDGPTLVGENGPELFIPQRSGTVIPNAQMSSMGGSQPSTVINGPYIASMSAIDTQSAAQFLAKNKNSVWSANQSAARGLPTNR